LQELPDDFSPKIYYFFLAIFSSYDIVNRFNSIEKGKKLALIRQDDWLMTHLQSMIRFPCLILEEDARAVLQYLALALADFLQPLAAPHIGFSTTMLRRAKLSLLFPILSLLTLGLP
jgi:hypothetical protein